MPIYYNQHIKIDGTDGPKRSLLQKMHGSKKIRWYAKSYEFVIQRLLREIEKSQTGKIIIRHISKKVTIQPFKDITKAGASASLNLKGGTEEFMRRYRFATERGEWVRAGQNREKYNFLLGNNQRGPLRGFGIGQNAFIRFTPALFDTRSKLYHRRKIQEWNPAPVRVLVHELVHSARMTTGHYTYRKLPVSLKKWANTEEFISIMITNIFSSETNRNLRRHHIKHELRKLRYQKKFLTDPEIQKVIEYFCHKQPNLSFELSKVDARFNPLREYYKSKGANRTKKLQGVH